MSKSLTDRLLDVLNRRSVRRGNFVLSSGKKSNYYIDARLTTMSGDGLKIVGQLGAAAIRDAGWDARAVGGLTLGADPVAYAIALASHDTGRPLDAFTVRKEPKTHGTGQVIEGCFAPGDRVVIVEDVLTTGASALRAAAAIRAAGGHIAGVLAVVDREEGGAVAVTREGHPLRTLVSIRQLGLTPPTE
jgi:orotate phosphoribosyltransferase